MSVIAVLLASQLFWDELWPTLSFSDIILIIAPIPVLLFLIGYMIKSPWIKDELGAMVVLSAAALAGLLFLIVWGIVFGQKVEEPIRAAVALMVLFAASGKYIIWLRERQKGKADRLAREARKKELLKAIREKRSSP